MIKTTRRGLFFCCVGSEVVELRRALQGRTLFAALVSILCIPVVIAADVYLLNDRGYYAAGLAIVVLSMLPFAFAFEGRRPQSRELVVIAAMVALTVAGRAAFFMTPQFKPVAALVIISGAALGAESGFAVGAVSAFVSNFIFGQGPWTPWQMFSFGIIGFVSGLVFGRLSAAIGEPGGVGTPGGSESDSVEGSGSLGWSVRARRRLSRIRIALLCAFGFVSAFIIYGLVMDTAAMAIFPSSASEPVALSAFLAVYISGIPFNLIHAVSTVIFLAVLAQPIIEKLERVKKKYGLLR
jgi:energy-coupling factor transport system substrate-specific component